MHGGWPSWEEASRLERGAFAMERRKDSY